MLPWLSAYLGHRNLLGTERYLHATPEHLNTASGRLRQQLLSDSVRNENESTIHPSRILIFRSFTESTYLHASANTIEAYRDAITLFIRFVADRRGVQVSKLQLIHLDERTVSAFLTHHEQHRHNGTRTRNNRRIALRGGFQHALRLDPTQATQYARILAIPAKRCSPTAPRYLEPNQMRNLLAQPDRHRQPTGQRDYGLLIFLYNTGARISEALGCRFHDIYRYIHPQSG
jgi:site-specific recombinase XerD